MLDHALIQYLKSLERDNASPYTVKNYGTDIGQFLDYCAERNITTLPGLDREVVRDYLAELNDVGYAEASIARRVFELRAFGDYLLHAKAWEENVFRRIHAPRVPRRLPRYLTLAEVEQLLAVPNRSLPQGQRDAAILETLYAAGVRVSELVGLNLRDVHLNVGELRVIGKGNKERLALLGQPAVAALRVYLSDGRTALVGKRACNALFLNRFGGQLSVRSVS